MFTRGFSQYGKCFRYNCPVAVSAVICPEPERAIRLAVPPLGSAVRLRPGQNATALAMTIAANVMSSTGRIGVMAPGGIPRPWAKSAQLNRPAATPSGRPARRASPVSVLTCQAVIADLASEHSEGFEDGEVPASPSSRPCDPGRTRDHRGMEVSRGDGSVIAVEVAGAQGGRPVLFCHGLADARLSVQLFGPAARAGIAAGGPRPSRHRPDRSPGSAPARRLG